MGEVSNIKKEEGNNKKRGRRKKSERVAYELNKEQSKFFVDLSNEKDTLEIIQRSLLKANDKKYGRVINFKDIALFGIAKLTEKDIAKIQNDALTDMERVEQALIHHNRKNNLNLTLGEFLTKKLCIS